MQHSWNRTIPIHCGTMASMQRFEQRSNGTPTHPITPEVQGRVEALARRRLLLPALLFLSAHRPLAFLAGQLLWMAQPVGGLLLLSPGMQNALEDWARLLSHPQGPAALEQMLATQTYHHGHPRDA